MSEVKRFYRTVVQVEEVVEHNLSPRVVEIKHRRILSFGDDFESQMKYVHEDVDGWGEFMRNNEKQGGEDA